MKCQLLGLLFLREHNLNNMKVLTESQSATVRMVLGDQPGVSVGAAGTVGSATVCDKVSLVASGGIDASPQLCNASCSDPHQFIQYLTDPCR